jgi:drug/metabolite transporter (DMT)-like permease
VLLVVPLSLLAALLFAAAAAFQQAAAHRTAASAAQSGGDQSGGGQSGGGQSGGGQSGGGRSDGVEARPGRLVGWLPVLGFLGPLVTDRIWLAGWVTNLVGFLTQAAALHLGSISVVQPLLVAQLLFALPLSTLRSRRRLLPRDWLGAGTICVGLVVLLSVRGAAPQSGTPSRLHVLLATAAAAVLVVGAVAAARAIGREPQLRAALVSVAAGVCFAMSAVFITLTTADLVHRGVGATAVDWPGYALAGSTALGLLLEQDAFATGSLPTAVAAMTITNPVASYLAGVLAFDTAAPGSPGALAGVAVAALLLVVGVIVLSQSPAVRDEYGPAQQQASPPGRRSATPRPSGAADSVG